VRSQTHRRSYIPIGMTPGNQRNAIILSHGKSIPPVNGFSLIFPKRLAQHLKRNGHAFRPDPILVLEGVRLLVSNSFGVEVLGTMPRRRQPKVVSENNCINFWAGDCSSSRHETCLS
jgi:hypothetical protein